MFRRHFLATTAACTLLPLRRLNAGAATSRIRPFAPSRVRLRPGPVLDAAEVNRRFVLGQDPDRLLHNFRRNAGLGSNAAPLGGWEAPDNELRGHYVGHYLSACALIWASAGDAQAKQRGDKVVAALAECQRARGSGYLSAFPEELFDRLRRRAAASWCPRSGSSSSAAPWSRRCSASRSWVWATSPASTTSSGLERVVIAATAPLQLLAELSRLSPPPRPASTVDGSTSRSSGAATSSAAVGTAPAGADRS